MNDPGPPPPVDLSEAPIGLVPEAIAASLEASILGVMKNAGGRPGVHAESLLACIGAVAGHCSIHLVWETKVNRGVPPRAAGLLELKVADGHPFFLGDVLNRCLVPEPPGTQFSLWQNVARAAVAAGVPYGELPDYREMFRYIVGTIGKPEFGFARVPEAHRPFVRTPDALRLLWPLARKVLTEGTQSNLSPPSGEMVQYWPVIANFAAGRLVRKANGTLDPRLSVRLVMEAAIAASGVDPRTVPQSGPGQG